MDSGQKPQIKIKKVKPYPFDATIDQAGQKKVMEVLFISQTGLIARLNKVFVKPGEHYPIQFEFPVIGHSIFTTVQVLKTYDKALSIKDLTVERMAEFHFDKLNDDHKEYLFSFLTAIGQAK